MTHNRHDTSKTVERSVLAIPARYTGLLRRLLNLPRGRYMIVVTVGEQTIDWSVKDLGKVEL